MGLAQLFRKEADYFAYSNGDEQFYFNLCGATVDPRCNGAGACLVSRKKFQQNWVNIGRYEDASITLNEKKEIVYSMKGTGNCNKSSTPATLSTDIHLVCSEEEQRPQFHFLEDPCRYHLSWHTPRVCFNQVANDGCSWKTYSLKPLRRNIDTKVESDSMSYFLNVCGPLTSNQCGENATACALSSKDQSSIVIANHPGQLRLDNGTLVWEAGGQKCPDGTHSSTEIRFPCISSLQSPPRVVYGGGLCGKTVFEWPSYVGCHTSNSTSSGAGTFFLVLFLLVLAYFVLGYLFLRFNLGYQGLEAIPHYEAMNRLIEWIRLKWSGAGSIRI